MSPDKNPISVQDSQVRVRRLASCGSAVGIDACVPVHRYFRSGTEMLRMAKMYTKDQQLENAFVLYSKYITLFVEKLPKHPGYAVHPAKDKSNIKEKLKEIFPLAEKIKSILLERYSVEYKKWLKEMKEQEAERELEQLEREEKMWQQSTNIVDELNRGPVVTMLAENTDFSKPKSVVPESVLFGEKSGILTPADASVPDNKLLDFSLQNKKNQGPVVDRSTKPHSILSPYPELENSHGLRTVIVPASLMTNFLQLSVQNTSRNIETCGILAGKMSHSQLLITHLLVPKQTGTSDSCDTDNEEEIFSYQDKYDLITIGWIHTHPSQTAFMSSVDLHTHCSYQIMLSESIAIVCSPKFEQTGIYSLTEFGLDYIANCQEKGFHLHVKEPLIYEESSHVKINECGSVTVIDLR